MSWKRSRKGASSGDHFSRLEEEAKQLQAAVNNRQSMITELAKFVAVVEDETRRRSAEAHFENDQDLLQHTRGENYTAIRMKKKMEQLAIERNIRLL